MLPNELVVSRRAESRVSAVRQATLRLSFREGFLKRREKWRTLSDFGRCYKEKPALEFRVEVAHPPVAALLLYEHTLVRYDDVRKLNAVFFPMNGVISVVFLLFVANDLLFRK